MIILVRPYGEFPLNDDWAYSLPVKWYLETGQLHLTFWQFMTLVTQIVLGVAWTALVGFSLEHLRILVILLTFLFLWAAYALSREAGLSKAISFFIVLTFLSFPIFPVLAMSFMTDVPFLALGTASFYFLLAAMNRDHNWLSFYTAGATLLIAAILLRQTGIAIALAFVLGDLIKNGVRAKVLLRAGSLFIVSAAILIAYPVIMEASVGLPALYRVQSQSVLLLVHQLFSFKLGAAKPLLRAIFAGSIYMGLLTLPLTLGLLVSRVLTRKFSPAELMLTTTGGGILLILAIALQTPIPVLGGPDLIHIADGADVGAQGGVLGLSGVGMRNVSIYDVAERSIRSFWWVLTAVSSVCAAFLFSEIAIGLWSIKRSILRPETRPYFGRLVFFATVAGVSYLPYGLSYSAAWFDRYVLFSALPLLIMCGMLNQFWQADVRRAAPLVVGLFVIALATTTIMTRDFFSWTRVRWALIEQAIAGLGLAPDQLDGGFEYNNYWAFKDLSPNALPEELELAENRPFRITTRPLVSYDVVSEKKVGQILPLDSDVIFLLKKK